MATLNIPRVLLVSRYGPDPIVHVFLLISDLIFCEITPLYFWVQLNAKPNCVVVQNLYWTSVIKDTTTKHTFGCTILLRNFTKD